MNQYQFKTNINCGGCIATVTPFMEKESKIVNWEVETDHPDKRLTVEANGLTADDITLLLSEAGFQATPLKRGIFQRLFEK